MTLILGINAFHADAAAAIVKDGTIIGAVEEERFRRIKHWAGFPSESIRWCLREASVGINEIDHISINTQPKAHRLRRVFYSISTRANPAFLIRRWKNKQERNNLREQLQQAFPDTNIMAELHFIEHHHAHLASAFYPSPFGDASIVSVDGFGDFASGAWGFGSGSGINIDGHIFFPHSLGAFYTAITQFLGFPNYGDEYKVMGLAPYGSPKYIEQMNKLVKLNNDGSYSLDMKYFQHSGKKDLDHQWSHGTPVVGKHWDNQLEVLLGPARVEGGPIQQHHMDIARSAQVMYENALYHLLDSVYSRNGCPNLCIAGGCGANSVANGKISLRTKFKNVYVQAAAGDAGGALGSALEVWHRLYQKRCSPMNNAYLGYASSQQEIDSLLKTPSILEELAIACCSVRKLDDNSICEEVSDALTQGLVVGWFEGKMEWGPRALGHRSIIGDPRRADMKDILNLKIKRRESFRPFAPSVLREAVYDWFETDGDVPFMMQVYSIREEKRQFIPAVTHVDGSGRLQTVTKEDNCRYYQLIQSFFQKTGVPMILNTSFNENEPIVCSSKEALNCFLRTKMDILVMENVIIRRRDL
ncbi:MAG: carbamoyltransferase [Cyanobacteriota bacterium]|jgi:carbamoyltransferase